MMNTGLDDAVPRRFTRCRRTAGLADRAASPGFIVELPIATEVLVILLLILANAVFAMSEMAVVAARKVRLQQRADDGDERAAAALQLANHPAQFLSTVQVGITLVGILAGAYGGATIAEKLAVYIAATVPQLAPLRERCRAGDGGGRHCLPVAGDRRAGAEEHRADTSRDHCLVGGPADDVAVARRRAVRGAA